MRHYVALLAAATLLLLAAVPCGPAVVVHAQEQVSAGQKQALYTKPAVVRIYDGCVGSIYFGYNQKTYKVSYVGSGSGAFIDKDGYILTNAHVTETTKNGEEKAKEALYRQYLIQIARDYGKEPRELLADDNLVRSILGQSRLVSYRPINLVIVADGSSFPFEIKSFGAPVGEGKDVSIIKIEVKNAPILKLGDSEKVQLQDHITVYGYPGAADTDLLDSKSALEASITDGKVSAKKNTADGAPVLQVSAAATHGNSGGPVLNDNGDVVGILTFRGDTVGGQEVSGFTFVVPTRTIQEFVKQAGANNAPGIVDQKYREALGLYWDGYYTDAIAKFTEVKQLFPQHSEAERLITAARQAQAEGKERSGMPIFGIAAAAVVVVGGGLVVILLGVGLILFLRKGKAKAAHAPGVPTPAKAAPPPFGQPTVDLPKTPYGSQGGGWTPAPAPLAPAGGDRTVALPSASASASSAITRTGFGALLCVQGALAGQRFEIRPDGIYIGRDGTLSQVVIADGRVSKRHVWVGPRNGKIVAIDQQSTNGTFLNVPGSQRITEAILQPGDTVILSEADVARFRYQI